MRLRIRENMLIAALRLLRAVVPARPLATSPRRILAISTTALGDTVWTSAGLASLRAGHPGAEIALLVAAPYVPLLQGRVEADLFFPYAGRYSRFFRTAWTLRRYAPDVVCIFHANDPQGCALAGLSGAPAIYRLPNDRTRFRFLLGNATPVVRMTDLGHAVEWRLRTAALAGGAPGPARIRIMVTDADRAEGETLLAGIGLAPGGRVVGFQLGASSPARQWTPRHFATLARDLLDGHPDVSILINTSPAEAPLAAQLAACLPAHPRVVYTHGRVPLRLLPAMMDRLAALVTGDTGPLHLAIATGTPTLSLFTCSDPGGSGPFQDPERHRVIYRPCTSAACNSKRCIYAEPACMAEIMPTEVLIPLNTLLALSPG